MRTSTTGDTLKSQEYFEALGSRCAAATGIEYINMDQCIERSIKVAERLNQERLANV
jgi:hypothetical protein